MNNQIGEQGHPDLSEDSVFAGTDERLNLQVLLYPLEKQLDFPARFINIRNGFGVQIHLGRKVIIMLLRVRVFIGYSTQRSRVLLTFLAG